MILLSQVICSTLLGISAGGNPAPTTGPADITVFADMVYSGDGTTFKNAMVAMSGGKIVAITPDVIPGDGDMHVAAITPGMVDLSAHITGIGSVEETNEVTPNIRVADSIDLFRQDWDRQLRHGVTTVVVNPNDRNCIGGLSIALKTGGTNSVAARTVKADVALRGAFGSMPSSGNHPAYGRPTDFFSRRPTTRMGVEWAWRKAMYDALQAEGKEDRAFEGLPELLRALDGDLPVFVQAWATQDIRTAVFLKEEMAGEGKADMRLIIDAGAESWREIDFLVRTKTSVVLPPFSASGRTTDGAFYANDCAMKLDAAGVLIALSSHNAQSVGAHLEHQAAFARRGGLSFDAALAAVSINPARMIGIADRVGSIEVGKDADLALWNGTPFELSSRVVGVVLNGDLVKDPR
ncbi:MAG: imidazolonepropionase-like amidohydrolase [Planctomycetota bacterium]|jgi:imidazolonepropionase-like amidohydrolase